MTMPYVGGYLDRLYTILVPPNGEGLNSGITKTGGVNFLHPLPPHGSRPSQLEISEIE